MESEDTSKHYIVEGLNPIMERKNERLRLPMDRGSPTPNPFWIHFPGSSLPDLGEKSKKRDAIFIAILPLV